jgi:hypothetical protein
MICERSSLGDTKDGVRGSSLPRDIIKVLGVSKTPPNTMIILGREESLPRPHTLYHPPSVACGHTNRCEITLKSPNKYLNTIIIFYLLYSIVKQCKPGSETMASSQKPIFNQNPNPNQTANENVRWIDGTPPTDIKQPRGTAGPAGINAEKMDSANAPPRSQPIDNRQQPVTNTQGQKKSLIKIMIAISVIINIILVGLFGYYLNRTNQLSDDIKDWEGQYDNLNSENDGLYKDVTLLKKDKRELTDEYSSLYDKYNESLADYESLDQDHSALQVDYDNLDTELNELKINYSDIQDDLESFKSDYNELNETYYDLIEYYYNQTQVLQRDRKIYHKYAVTCSWPGYSNQLSYTFEWTLSGYFKSLRRDHSFDWQDSESVIKFAKSYDVNNFKEDFLLNEYPNKADRANAILDIVHALEYRLDPPSGEDVRYPEETLIEGCGDCEDVAILCAAMMEGNGLDAILLAWPGHINTAVHLTSPPPTDTGSAWYLEYNNKRYYCCEPTGSYGSDIGRLGEDYQGEKPIAIYDV